MLSEKEYYEKYLFQKMSTLNENKKNMKSCKTSSRQSTRDQEEAPINRAR